MRSSVLVVAILLASPCAASAAKFGSIAYSRKSGEFGVHWGAADSKRAKATALADCASDDCEIVISVSGEAYGAVATGDNDEYGWAFGPNWREVFSSAVSYCSKVSENCSVTAWVGPGEGYAASGRVSHDWRDDFTFTIGASLREQILDDIEFIRSIKGSSATPLYTEIFGGDRIDGQTLYGYLHSRLDSFFSYDCADPGAAACAIVGTKLMGITSNYSKLSVALRISALFHEAAHLGPEGRYHSLCPTPFLDENGKDVVGPLTGTPFAGKPYCDRTAEGSFGVQLSFLMNAARFCINCSDEFMQDARLVAGRYITLITDEQGKVRNDLFSSGQ